MGRIGICKVARGEILSADDLLFKSGYEQHPYPELRNSGHYFGEPFASARSALFTATFSLYFA